MNDASRPRSNASLPIQRRLTVDGFGRIEDVGKFLLLTPSAVEDLIRLGDLPYADFRGSVRIPWRAVMEYAAARLFEPPVR